ncbi:uncharacterized protein [Euphorbia lathyris]|uniref:uncharacterized protein n=1 Tax=Euphorbia lathyris TaxID=212925 RepID=UPI003313D1C4
MEKIADHIKPVELKQESIRKTRFDGFQSKNKHISDLGKWIEDFSLNLNSKQRQLYVALKEIDVMLNLKREELDSMHNELAMKKMQLGTIEKSIEQQNEEFKSHEENLGLVKVKFEESCKNLSIKNKQLESVKESLQVHYKVLTIKKNQLSTVVKSIEERTGQLNSEDMKLLCVKGKHEKCCQDLAVKTKQLESAQKELEVIEKEVEKVKTYAANCNEELELKQKGLAMVKSCICDCNIELELKQKQLETLQGLSTEVLAKRKQYDMNNCSEVLKLKLKHLDSVSEELQSKEKHQDAIYKAINKCSAELKKKQTEVEFLDKSITKLSSKFGWKKKNLVSIEKRIKWLTGKLRSKEEDFNSLKATMRTYCKDLELKVREFNAIRESIRERNEELALKEKFLKSIQMSITERSEQLEPMKENLDLVKISLKECSTELESKKKNLELVKISLKECCNDLISKEAEYDSMQRTICGLRKDHEEREKHFDSLKTTLEERSRKLEMKEKQFEACLKKFEPFDFHLEAHQPDNSCTANSQSSTSIDEKTFPSILTDDMCDNDSLPNEVLAALKSSADPAMFVLCVMQDSYSHCSKNCGAGLDTSVKTKILLMERLIEVSPTISPAVKAQAAKLVVSWKANLSSGTEKLTEIWAFLMFLAAYKLVHHFGGEEILKLVLAVASQRNAPNICRLLDFTDKIPEIIERLIERKQDIDAARFSRITELENRKALCSRAASLLTPASFNTQRQYRDGLLFEGKRKRARTGTP